MRYTEPRFIETAYKSVPVVSGEPPRIHMEPVLLGVTVDGPVADWIDDRKIVAGEEILPVAALDVVDMIEKRKETVAWVRRSEVGEDGHLEHYYQLVCDCVACLDPEAEDFEEVYACRALGHAIVTQAVTVSTKLGHLPMLEGRRAAVNSTQLDGVGRHIVADMTKDLLVYERFHPYDWPANAISGSLLVSALAVIFGTDKLNMAEIVEEMQEDGEVELHGDEVVTLREELVI